MKRIICVAPSRALGRKKRTRPSRSRSPDATRRSPYEAGGVPRAPRSSTPDAPQRRSALGAATYAPSPGGPPTAPRHDAPRRDLLTRAPSARRAHETPQGKLMSWPWTHPFSRPGPPSIPVRFSRAQPIHIRVVAARGRIEVRRGIQDVREGRIGDRRVVQIKRQVRTLDPPHTQLVL